MYQSDVDYISLVIYKWDMGGVPSISYNLASLFIRWWERRHEPVKTGMKLEDNIVDGYASYDEKAKKLYLMLHNYNGF